MTKLQELEALCRDKDLNYTLDYNKCGRPGERRYFGYLWSTVDSLDGMQCEEDTMACLIEAFVELTKEWEPVKKKIKFKDKLRVLEKIIAEHGFCGSECRICKNEEKESCPDEGCNFKLDMEKVE